MQLRAAGQKSLSQTDSLQPAPQRRALRGVDHRHPPLAGTPGAGIAPLDKSRRRAARPLRPWPRVKSPKRALPAPRASHRSTTPGANKKEDVVELTRDQMTEMYRRMVRIRCFEEQVVELAARGELAGAAHTSIGEEATIVGACVALRTDDYMVGTHRSHGHTIG